MRVWLSRGKKGRQMELYGDSVNGGGVVIECRDINWITVRSACWWLSWTPPSGRTGASRGVFFNVYWENCQMTCSLAVTMVTALTSDTSGAGRHMVHTHTHTFLCETFQSELRAAARSPFQRRDSMNFLCVQHSCHACFLFSLHQFPTHATMQTGLQAEQSVLIFEFQREGKCAEFFWGCKDWENISLSMDKYLD